MGWRYERTLFVALSPARSVGVNLMMNTDAKVCQATNSLQYTKIRQATDILVRIFDEMEKNIIVGLNPALFKAMVFEFAQSLGVELAKHQVAFCRDGQLHPSMDDTEPLREGEAFTLDMWLSYGGVHADLARIYLLPPVGEVNRHLQQAAYAVRDAAFEAVKSGVYMLDIVEAVQQVARNHNVYVVEGACGHGIGALLHQHPEVAFCYTAGAPFDRLCADQIITIEPVITLKKAEIKLFRDGRAVLSNREQFLYCEAMVYVGLENTHIIGQ
jgi:methionine aminopeptidase